MTKRPVVLGATSAKAKVMPAVGWNVSTKYGTLNTPSDKKLVRLEDVHSFLCASGIPARDAVYRIFSPFYRACQDADERGDQGDLALPGDLYVINTQTWPDGLLTRASVSKARRVRVFATAFPDLGHIQFEKDSVGSLIFSIAEGALRVWHGIADITTDRLAVWDAQQEGALDEQYGIRWPSDEALREVLGRIAVPTVTAYELWGWGSVGVVVPLKEASKLDAEPVNWSELVKFRLSNPRASWSVKQKGILSNESDRRRSAPDAKGVAAGLATELGISVQNVNERIRNKSDLGKRAKSQKRAA